MNDLINIMKLIAVLVAAILIGGWFQDEVRKARFRREPWYKPYISLPGLIILVLILVFPVLIWLKQH